ncbi:MAG: hypothetical protein R3B70_38030 [Polyangiaceae bacterium]
MACLAWLVQLGAIRLAHAIPAEPTVGPASDPDIFERFPGDGYAYSPAVARGDTNSLVAWSERRSRRTGFDLVAARIGHDGTLLDPAGIILSQEGNASAIRAAHGGGGYLVVWTSGTGCHELIWLPDEGGAPVAGTQGVFCNAQSFELAISYGNGVFLLMGLVDKKVSAVRVQPGAVVIDPLPFEIHDGQPSQPVMAFDGERFTVVWWEYGVGTMISRVPSVGDPDPAKVLSYSEQGYLPAMACHQGTCGLSFVTNLGGGYSRLHAWCFESGGQFVGDDLWIAETLNGQTTAPVAFDGQSFVVAWNDLRNVPGPSGPIPDDVYTARFSPACDTLDGSGVSVKDGSATAPFGTYNGPALGGAEDGAIVAWVDFRHGEFYLSNIYATRIGASGEPMDSPSILVSGHPRSPGEGGAIAGEVRGILLAYTAAAGSDLRRDLFTRALDSSGLPQAEGPATLATNERAQNGRAVAFGGAAYLAAWSEYLNDQRGSYARLVSSTGEALAPAITLVEGDSGPTSVASDGTSFLVVYRANENLAAALIDPSGALLKKDIVLSTGSPSAFSVAFDGSQYVVAFQQKAAGNNDTDILAVRVNPDGIPGPVFDVCTAPGYQLYPSLACTTAMCAVIWADSRDAPGDVYAARLFGETVADPDGVPIQKGVFPGQEDAYKRLAAARMGDRVLLAWVDSTPGGDTDVYATWMLSDGPSADPPVRLTKDQGEELSPTLLGLSDEEVLLVYERFDANPEVQARRLAVRKVSWTPGSGGTGGTGGTGGDGGTGGAGGSGNGGGGEGGQGGSGAHSADPGTQSILGWNCKCDLSGAGTGTDKGTWMLMALLAALIAARRRRATGAFGAVLVFTSGCAPDGAAQPEHPSAVSAAQMVSNEIAIDAPFYVPDPDDQENPALAYDGDGYRVVWSDRRKATEYGTVAQIYSVHVSLPASPQTGQTTLDDPGGLPITQSGEGRYYPDIAFDGARHLVVWVEKGGDVRGCFLTKDGVPEKSAPGATDIELAFGTGSYPSVAFGGGEYLLVWRNGTSIEARTVQTDGSLSEIIPVSTKASGVNQGPRVAWGPGEFLTVWAGASAGGQELRAARLLTNGTLVGGSDQILLSPGFEIDAPSVASDGSDWYVAFTSHGDGSPDYRVEGALFDASLAQLGPPVVLSKSTGDPRRPVVRYNGGAAVKSYFVLWVADPDGAPGQYDVYGRRVDPATGNPWSAEIEICNAPGQQGYTITPSATLACEPVTGGCQAVWRDTRNGEGNFDIYGTGILPSGLAFDTAGYCLSLTANREQRPAAATGPQGEIFVAWEDYRATLASSAHIYGARITSTGAPVEPDSNDPDLAKALKIGASVETQAWPSVAFNGERYLVVWSQQAANGDDIFAQIYQADGQPFGAVFPVCNAQETRGRPPPPRTERASSSFGQTRAAAAHASTGRRSRRTGPATR